MQVAEPEGTRATEPVPLRLECWQNGELIIQESGLEGLNLGAVLREHSALFRRQAGEAAEVVVLALGDATCLVRPQAP